MDTNAAGDWFAGGILAGLYLNKKIPQQIDIGHYIAK